MTTFVPELVIGRIATSEAERPLAGHGLAWGSNAYGQLGRGSTTNAAFPVTVSGYNRGAAPIATYAYNGDGLRAAKTVAGITKSFTWDSSGGLPLLIDDGTFAYVYGPDGLPLEQIGPANTVTFFHHDQIGSTATMTNIVGATVATTSYDPYGRLTASAGTPGPLGFTGEYTDAETGFVYLRARYYDPATAQFLTRDPLEVISGSPYGYVYGDPLNSVDPSGQLPFLVPILVGAVIGGGLDLGLQLAMDAANGCGVSLGNVNWTQVGISAALGAAGGGLGAAAKGARAARMGATTRATMPTPGVGSTKLQNIVSDLYKGTTNPGRIGTGTTADALRYELSTRQRLFGKSHLQKAQDSLRGLENWLKANPNAPYHDRLVARSLADDLLDALGSAP